MELLPLKMKASQTIFSELANSENIWSDLKHFGCFSGGLRFALEHVHTENIRMVPVRSWLLTFTAYAFQLIIQNLLTT